MNADGSGLTNLTRNSANDWFPAWSPNGKQIAFVSDRSGDREIHVMDANGAALTRITFSAGFDLAPAWTR